MELGAEELARLQQVDTFSIAQRQHKVHITEFVHPQDWPLVRGLQRLFPGLLKGHDIVSVVESVVAANRRQRTCLMGMGAHVIKCGLSLILVEMMRRGWLHGLAMNGAGVIHDVEIALIGETSEEVAQSLGAGRFGMVDETPRLIHDALRQYDSSRVGFGAAMGRAVAEGDYPYKAYSLLAASHTYRVPLTVHAAIGADTIHMHPAMDAAVFGQATYRDFQRLTMGLRGLHEGGCYWNIGSAVLLPEVFLKALTLCRNIGYPVERFTTVNLDMVQHYRPEYNVVRRPTQEGGAGYTLIGHHEIMVPLLYAMIAEQLDTEEPGGRA